MTMKKILVVEDSPADRNNLEEIIRNAEYEVLTATNGKEGMEIALKESPCMIFMDIVMDDTDGYEAARNLSNDASTKSIPIVFVSSKHQKADRVWAKMQGGKDLVSKPYTPEQILDQIKTYG